MKQSVANLLRALVVLLLFVPAPLSVVNATPAMAEPAVILPEAGEEEAEEPWTSRFLVPAVVLIAIIPIGASAAYYVVRVRGRYRVA